MDMPPISASLNASVQRSCNWRCCICIFPSKVEGKVSLQTQTSPAISELAFERLKHIAFQKK